MIFGVGIKVTPRESLNMETRAQSTVPAAFIELVLGLVISNMQYKFEQDTLKTFKVIVPQGQNIDVKCVKSQ